MQPSLNAFLALVGRPDNSGNYHPVATAVENLVSVSVDPALFVKFDRSVLVIATASPRLVNVDQHYMFRMSVPYPSVFTATEHCIGVSGATGLMESPAVTADVATGEALVQGVGAHTSDPHRIVVAFLYYLDGIKTVTWIGDSQFGRWNLPLFFPDLRTINKGISGETTVDVKNRFASDALRPGTDAVVLMAGTNNPGEQAVPDIIAMAQMARDAKKPCLVCLPPPLPAANGFSALLDQTLAANGFPKPIDFYTLFQYLDGSRNESLFEAGSDNVHVKNPEAYIMMRGVLRPQIDAILNG